MTTLEAVALSYEAWQQKQGDFRDVPLADAFEFSGPVASFDTPKGYRANGTGRGTTTGRRGLPRAEKGTVPPTAESGSSQPRPRDPSASTVLRGSLRGGDCVGRIVY